MSPSPASAPCIVLDTNVVLDWLVFDNPACVGLATQIASRDWRWIATQAMADELAAVLQYPAIRRWPFEEAQVWQRWAQWTHLTPEAPRSPLTCADADDQKFIDLALAHPAQHLLTRDRALLKLARRAAAWQVSILTPAALQAGCGPTGSFAATAAAISLR